MLAGMKITDTQNNFLAIDLSEDEEEKGEEELNKT
jgi:hypothetical protein